MCLLALYRLQLVSVLAWGAGSSHCSLAVLFHKFPAPLHLQGASCNFLVLRLIKQLGLVMTYGVQLALANRA